MLSIANKTTDANKVLSSAKKTLLFLISVGKEYHEGDMLISQVNYFERLIQACVSTLEDPRSKAQPEILRQNAQGEWDVIIMVADTLQAYNDASESDEYAKLESWRAKGKDYVRRNTAIFEKLQRAGRDRIKVNLHFIHWDDAKELTSKEYAPIFSKLSAAYAQPGALRDAVNKKGHAYLSRPEQAGARAMAKTASVDPDALPERNLQYILEELVILYHCAAKGKFGFGDEMAPLFIVYPSLEEDAFIQARQFFKTSQQVLWLGLKLHSNSPKNLPSLFGSSGQIKDECIKGLQQHVYCELFSLKPEPTPALLDQISLPNLSVSIDRNEMYDELVGKLSSHDVVICHGLGGMGKSHLVTSYAERNQERYPTCIWSTQNKLNSTFAIFAAKLGLASKKDKPKDIVAKVKRYLEEHPGWLLIIDNVENGKALQDFFPKKGGKIFITTRLKNINFENAALVEVPNMSREEANTLLQTVSGETSQDFSTLSARLGDLPLALIHAAQYLKQHRDITCAEYIGLYERFESDLQSDLKTVTPFQSKPVLVTWKASFIRVKKALSVEPKFLDELMLLLSLLDHTSITMTLLASWYEGMFPELHRQRPGLMAEAITKLRDLSLLGGAGEIDIHPVVQDIHLQTTQSHPEQLDRVASFLSAYYFKMAEDNFFLDKKHIRESLAHLMSALKKMSLYTKSPQPIAQMQYALATLYRHYDNELSVTHYRSALARFIEAEGSQSQAVTRIRFILFEIYTRLGTWAEFPAILDALSWLEEKKSASDCSELVEFQTQYYIAMSVHKATQQDFTAANEQLLIAEKLALQSDDAGKYLVRIRSDIVKLALATQHDSVQGQSKLRAMSDDFFSGDLSPRQKMEVIDLHIDLCDGMNEPGWLAELVGLKLAVQEKIAIEVAPNTVDLYYRLANAYLAMGYEHHALRAFQCIKDEIVKQGLQGKPKAWSMLCQYADLSRRHKQSADDVLDYITDAYMPNAFVMHDVAAMKAGLLSFVRYCIFISQGKEILAYIDNVEDDYPAEEKTDDTFKTLLYLKQIAIISTRSPNLARHLIALENESTLTDPNSREMQSNVDDSIATLGRLTSTSLQNYPMPVKKINKQFLMRKMIISNRFLSDCRFYATMLIRNRVVASSDTYRDHIDADTKALEAVYQLLPNCAIDEIDESTFSTPVVAGAPPLISQFKNAFQVLYHHYSAMVRQDECDEALFLSGRDAQVMVYRRPPLERLLPEAEQNQSAQITRRDARFKLLNNTLTLQLTSRQNHSLPFLFSENPNFDQLFLGRAFSYFRKFLLIKLSETLPKDLPPLINVDISSLDESRYQVTIKLHNFTIDPASELQDFQYYCQLSLFLAGLTPMFSMAASEITLPRVASLGRVSAAFFKPAAPDASASEQVSENLADPSP